MRILTELVGGIVLLLVFAWGVNETVKFLSTRVESTDVDTKHESAPPADDKPA